ncbi:uncharacterized protein EV422DRAFT_518222 [Fimicolochytrium jonesii]|uniref:uncharacterized protein n=1 Tax=Fimicolochytrium jonesii TaxID=1396493 RepID=UPI0022FDF983|nr:uncharacterized protein EV422DRAFT_518222 [Fimicolochytrium jonesii]KAI8825281.1 hypothetical protein EV422DRAFT_518222 [Fimicolochytrium jonesii]
MYGGGGGGGYRQQITGTNNIPLGTRRKRDDYDDHAPPPPPPIKQEYSYGGGEERRYNNVPPPPPASAQSDLADVKEEGREGRARKRRSRWGNEETKINIPGMPTVLPAGLAPEQLDAYVIHMRLEEIAVKLRNGDYVPPEKDRSRSPEPIYGADGKRINTREYRYRKKLEDERHKLVEEGLRKLPGFKPPTDYKRPSKTSDKIYIPVRDYPEINFIGQLIGPRGTTLKRIESDSGAKISIRGKGSVKEGKARADGSLAPGEEEDLHCLVTADSEDKVKIAIKAIEKVIETAASVPEGQNELKRMQLRYLAELNGTLRDDENQTCPNCGGVGHRRFECPEQKNFTVNLVCRICNGVGHAARDCMQRNDPEALREAEQRDQKLDSEYANLMAELGDSSAGAAGAGPVARSNHYGPGRPSGPPSAAPGGRPPWASGGGDRGPSTGGAGAPPPWARRDNGPPSGPPPPWQQDPIAPAPPGYGPPGMGPPGAPNMGPPGAPGMSPAPWNQPPPGAYMPPYGGGDYYGGGGGMGGPPGMAPPAPHIPAPAWAPPPPPPPADQAPPPPPPAY